MYTKTLVHLAFFPPKSFTPKTVTVTANNFCTKELYAAHRLHQKPFPLTRVTPEAFLHHKFTPRYLYTKVPLLSQAFAPKSHQRVFTPKHTKQPSQNQRPTKELLHHETFAPEGFTPLWQQNMFTPKKNRPKEFSHQNHLHQRHFTPKTFWPFAPKTFTAKDFYTTKVLFYTKQFLNQNASTPETFFANELVHGGDTSKSFPTKKKCATANSWNWKARSYLAVQKHTPYTTAAAKCKAKNDCACQHHPKPSEKSTRTSAALETQWNHTPQHESAQPWIAKLNAASVHSNTHTQTMLPWSANIQWRSPPRPNIACYKVITLMPAAKFSYVRTTRSHRKLATT